MTTIKDFKEVISCLLEMVGMVGKERLSAGTKHRLTGLAVDIVEVAEALNREVLERVKHEAVLDVDVDVDFVEWSELVLGAELAVRQDADEAVKEQTVLLNDALEALSSVLAEIDVQLSRHHKDEEYARLYELEKKRYLASRTARRAREHFEEWKELSCDGTPGKDDVTDYCVCKLLKMFGKGVFNKRVEQMQRAKRYPDEVDFDSLDDDQPMKGTAHRHYAALRRVVDWDDGRLVVNSVRAGRHFYACRHEENAKANRTNFLKYMHKIDLAQQELVREPEPEVKPLNFFAPSKHLKELLKEEWFKKLRAKDEYDDEWTDAFVNGLMASQWRECIAAEWAVQGERRKVVQIKGYVVGLLKDAGVLKGSYDSISAEMGITDSPRTFSKYMGDGKKQPYAEWVKNYVNE